MKTFTKQDLIKLKGKVRGSSMFLALRRYDLGTTKMTTVTAANRHGNHQALYPVIHFTSSEVIEWFTHKIKLANTNPERHPNPLWIKNWTEIVNTAKTLKRKIK